METKIKLLKYDVLLTPREYKNYKPGEGLIQSPEVVEPFWRKSASEELAVRCCGAHFSNGLWDVEEWGTQEVKIDEAGDEVEWGDIKFARPRYVVKFDGCKDGREVYSPEEAKKIAEGHPEAILEDWRVALIDPLQIEKFRLFMLDLNDFQKEALKGDGIANDADDLWVNVAGRYYRIPTNNVLGRKEREPFEASLFLENHLDADAWDDLYAEYLKSHHFYFRS